jgi:hypothetical protein
MMRYQNPLRARDGYVMLVALILMALIGVMGATSLSVAGVDQRIAHHNRKHLMLVNTSHAGTEHGRNLLGDENPPNENIDSAGDTWPAFIEATDGETYYGGISYASSNQNLGVYTVEAIYIKCSNPPPGYSTELGRSHFRSDYWMMDAEATMQDSTYSSVNATTARTVSTLRKVMLGSCKIR